MLSPAQIAFFKASGYLRVPAAQAQLDAELMERARADLWDGEPALVESDPSSWLGTVDELVDEGRGLTPEALSAAGHAGSRWIVRKSAKEDWMLQIVARNERIRGMISQLLGPWEGISEPGTRGLYCTRPCYRKSGERIPPELIEPRVDSDNKGPADTDGTSPCTSILGGEGIHSDGLGMDRVGAVAYIGDCPAGAGGFTVWPGSHTWLATGVGTGHLPEASGEFQTGSAGGGTHAPVPHPLPETHVARRTLLAQHPHGLEVAGESGDVVLWHGMILHTVGINYSHTIRTALLADFNQEAGRGSEEDCSADPARMWDRWSQEVREAPLPPLDPALCPWAAETTARL